MQVNLYTAEQGHREIKKLWEKIKPYLSSGQQFKLVITEMTRSLPQNSLFHAIIGDIAKQTQHFGAHWDTESWKRFLVDQWAQDTRHEPGRVVPSLDGKRIVQLGRQTRKFTKEEASEFTEWLMAWCVENGVQIEKED